MKILGIDPGFAKLGLALLEFDDDVVRAKDVRVVTTTKGTKKKLADLRVSTDDVRRARQLWDAMDAVGDLAPDIDAVAVEVYVPFQGENKRTKGAHRSAMAYALALAISFALDVPVIPVLPADVKQVLCGTGSASKLDVELAAVKRAKGLDPLLCRIRDSNRNHASDAAAVGLVGIEEVRQLKQLYEPRTGGSR